MPPSVSSTTVPGGTPTSRTAGLAPCRSPPSPWPPRVPLKCARRLNACRSRSDPSQTSTTSDPRPPSPPSGPPFGTCASRRNETAPLPPAPPWTKIFARSVSTALVQQTRPQSFDPGGRFRYSGPQRRRDAGAAQQVREDLNPRSTPRHQQQVGAAGERPLRGNLDRGTREHRLGLEAVGDHDTVVAELAAEEVRQDRRRLRGD